LLLASLFGLSLLLGGCFYGGLAGASLGQRVGPLGASRRAPRLALRVIGLLAATVGVGLLLGLPVLLLVGFTALVAPGLAVLGLGLGILGNAYIASGLIAAGMIFYNERAEPAQTLSPDATGASAAA